MSIQDKLLGGLQTSLRLLQTRLSLIGYELLAEHRRLSSIMMNLILIGCGLVALTQIGVLVIWLAWPDSSRLWALIGAGILFTSVVVVCVIRVRALLKEEEKPFNTTIEELQKDVECIQNVLSRD